MLQLQDHCTGVTRQQNPTESDFGSHAAAAGKRNCSREQAGFRPRVRGLNPSCSQSIQLPNHSREGKRKKPTAISLLHRLHEGFRHGPTRSTVVNHVRYGFPTSLGSVTTESVQKNFCKLLSGQLTPCRLGSVSEKEFDKGVTFHLVCSTSYQNKWCEMPCQDLPEDSGLVGR